MAIDGKIIPFELEKKYVHEVYDSIAESFSASRHTPWSGVMKFLKGLPIGAFGADVGCGNGKYLVAVDKQKLPLAPLLASDSSMKLLDLVRKRGFDAVAVNILALPYRPESLDYFICIAVLHHLSTPERRLEGLISIAELLKIGGLGLIQVWAKDQCWKAQPVGYVKKEVYEENILDTSVVPGGSVLPVQKPRTPFVASDVLLPWGSVRNKGEMVVRFYHLFEEGELEKLISLVPSLKLIECLYERGNWSAIVQKIESKSLVT
ncbi:unnamed protein product [Hymenolepis diminuta]|uniref:Methyltransf_11 domain-containing protein n=1 Tax=Hymenolepis diminuta TaxID=6216 RepID=A0A0R3SSQ5_HYMDI|nr:unnamed protein product [Hymenolepis diminuta]VUZ52316.1 unnamed protein product [Hymenolepis diminuta]